MIREVKDSMHMGGEDGGGGGVSSEAGCKGLSSEGGSGDTGTATLAVGEWHHRITHIMRAWRRGTCGHAASMERLSRIYIHPSAGCRECQWLHVCVGVGQRVK